MKKRLLLDMDGVIADVYAQYIRLEYNHSGVLYTPDMFNGKLEAEIIPNCIKHVTSEGFFRTAPVMEGSIEGVRLLNDRYQLYIVSSATEYPKSLPEKQAWLNEYFPFISWRQMVFCGDKSVVSGDIMVDDHPKNLDYFIGRRILFTQPHNIFLDKPDYERVDHWAQLKELLLL